MKKETLIKLSNALREKVYSKIPNLHFGGCGFAAATIIDALARAGEKAQLVCMNHCGHLLVEVKVRHGRGMRKVVFDCSDYQYEWDSRYEYGDIKKLKYDLRYYPNWNDAFDRRLVPELRRKIRNVVKDVVKPCAKLTAAA